MNGFCKAGITFFGIILGYDLLRRRTMVKHAEKLNDQQIKTLDAIKGLLETGKIEVPKDGISFSGLYYVADKYAMRNEKKE